MRLILSRVRKNQQGRQLLPIQEPELPCLSTDTRRSPPVINVLAATKNTDKLNGARDVLHPISSEMKAAVEMINGST